MNKIDRILSYALVISFIFINETTIQWLLAIYVGGMGVTEGFNDAFKYFTLSGYLFFSAFRLIPYLILYFCLKYLVKKKNNNYIGMGWGGLIGVLFIIIWGSWEAQHSYYTDAHTSSTTAIVFLFLPIYSIATGLIGGLTGYVINYVFNKLKTHNE